MMYGIRYLIFQYIHAVSNAKFYNDLFGDSSYITRYMQFIGYDLSKVVQTGSNFGTSQQHDNPLLCHIGTGTMVSDGLMMMNAQMSTSSFKVSKTVIGDNNYLGNAIFYPSDSKTGNKLPAGDQGHDPCRRSGARGCRSARLALLRDPEVDAARPADVRCRRGPS